MVAAPINHANRLTITYAQEIAKDAQAGDSEDDTILLVVHVKWVILDPSSLIPSNQCIIIFVSIQVV